MKRNDMLAFLLAAGITLVFTLTWLGPTQAGADSGEEAVPPLNPTPKLTVEGCELTLKSDKDVYDSGEKPQLIIEAVNPTKQKMEIPLRFTLTAAKPGSALSRVLEVPETLWTTECLLTLAPGERKTVRKETDKALPVEKEISVTMSSGKWLGLAHPLRVKPLAQVATVDKVMLNQAKAVNLP